MSFVVFSPMGFLSEEFGITKEKEVEVLIKTKQFLTVEGESVLMNIKDRPLILKRYIEFLQPEDEKERVFALAIFDGFLFSMFVSYLIETNGKPSKYQPIAHFLNGFAKINGNGITFTERGVKYLKDTYGFEPDEVETGITQYLNATTKIAKIEGDMKFVVQTIRKCNDVAKVLFFLYTSMLAKFRAKKGKALDNDIAIEEIDAPSYVEGKINDETIVMAISELFHTKKADVEKLLKEAKRKVIELEPLTPDERRIKMLNWAISTGDELLPIVAEVVVFNNLLKNGEVAIDVENLYKTPIRYFLTTKYKADILNIYGLNERKLEEEIKDYEWAMEELAFRNVDALIGGFEPLGKIPKLLFVLYLTLLKERS